MQTLKAANPDLQAYSSIVDKEVAGKAGANWGSSLDLAGMPEWAYGLAAENIMYTRSLIARNQDIVQENGSLDLSNIAASPLSVPDDVVDTLNNAAAAPAVSAPAPTAQTSAAAPEAPAATETSGASGALNNGAGALASPKVLVALMAALATIFML